MIELDPCDVIVSAVPMRDFILVFARSGAVYRVTCREEWDGTRVTVEKL